MINISIKEVRNRLMNINESQYTKLSPINVVNTYKKAMNEKSANLIESVIFNNRWRELNPNIDMAFTQVIYAFDKYCEIAKENQIDKFCNYICENVLSMVKDSTKAASYINKYYDKAVGGSIQQSMYNKILEICQANKACDRVIENYNKLSRRFNIDRIFNSNKDNYSIIIELSSLIDTYTIPDYAKYSIIIENSLYTMDKYRREYTREEIINAATDYFLMNRNFNESTDSVSFLSKMREVIANNPFYSDLLSESENNDIQFNQYFINKKHYDTINESNDELVLHEENKALILINKFKLMKEKDINKVLYLIEEIFTSSSNINHLVVASRSFLNMIENFYLCNNNYSTDSITNVVREYLSKLYEFTFTLDNFKTMRDILKISISNIDIAIENETNEEYKNRYREYQNIIAEYLNKIIIAEEAYNGATLEKIISEASIDDIASILLIENDIHYLKDTNLDIILDDMTKYMPKLSFDNIDAITKYSIENPEIIQPEKLKETYNAYYNTLKQEYTQNYILIDCLKENMYKLDHIEPVEEKEFTTEEAIYNLHCTAEGLRAIEEIFSICKEYDCSVLNELTFINSLKLAGERLKKLYVKMSDKEKQISRTIDNSMNMLRKAIESSDRDREAVIKGSILPPASKIIKTGIIFAGISWLANPVIAVIGLLGKIAISAKNRNKEKQLVLDEIDIELKMTERYLKVAEEKNDLKATKQLLTTQRSLERQRQRIKYNMKVAHRDVPEVNPKDYDED